MLNEVNIDFRILGLPHSVVKQAENSRVRELVKKIQPVQYDDKENDSGGGQRRAVSTVRDGP